MRTERAKQKLARCARLNVKSCIIKEPQQGVASFHSNHFESPSAYRAPLSLWVSSKAYIIEKKETYLKRGVSDILFMPAFLVLDDVSCNEKTHSLSWFHYSLSKSNFTSYYKPTIGYVAIVQSGWFFGYIVSQCFPYTSYKNWSGIFSERFKKVFEN